MRFDSHFRHLSRDSSAASRGDLLDIGMLSRLIARTALAGIAIYMCAQSALAQAPGQPWPPGPGAAPPPAGQSYQSQLCTRLEGQLATIDRGGTGDPARAEQIRRYEEASGKQQAELDRMV